MRRKTNELVPLEKQIIEKAQKLKNEFYGYEFAKSFRKDLISNGTLYRALDRLVKMGFIESRYDETFYPRRKYYKLTVKTVLDNNHISLNKDVLSEIKDLVHKVNE